MTIIHCYIYTAAAAITGEQGSIACTYRPSVYYFGAMMCTKVSIVSVNVKGRNAPAIRRVILS